MSAAHFAVSGRRAFNGEDRATVKIYRGPQPMIAVRPLRMRTVYALPLADVAAWVILQVVKAEKAERLRLFSRMGRPRR